MRTQLLLSLFLIACGGNARLDGGPDLDGGSADASAPADAGRGVDAALDGGGGCSAADLRACVYRSSGPWSAADPLVREDIEYEDAAGQTRVVRIAIRRPVGAPQPWPVIVYSHGGANGVVSPLGVGAGWHEAFTGAGYLFVAIAHQPRDEASREAMCAHYGVTELAVCARIKYLHWDRPHDLRAVLDYLEREAVGPLAGVVDLTRVLYMGHSAGSGGGSIVSGAHRDIYEAMQVAPDPRPVAFIGASMEGLGDDGFTETSFDAMARPHMTLSGVGDVTSDAPAEPRRYPFERMMPGDKYRVWLLDPAARHGTFDHNPDPCNEFVTAGGGDPARCAAQLVLLESAALAFADATLRELPAARAYLASDDLVTLGGGLLELDRR